MCKKLYTVLFVFFGIVSASAQVLVPLTSDKDRTATDPNFAGYRESGQPLSLPFFDDFAESDVQLNPTRWVLGQGVYLNNQFAINQPSKNVVTFDGLQNNGLPYDFNNTTLTGPVDTLTSKVIDLSGYSPADSLYLSFFWQAGGLGEAPQTGNSYLGVQFKKPNGNWTSLLDFQIKSDSTPGFSQKMISIAKASSIGMGPNYLYHNQFQFRIRSVGYRAGAGDVWNVDYVYLNANRNRYDTAYYDVATTQTPSSILAPYSAVPLNQYLANPNAFTADSVIQEAVNLYSQFRIARYKNYVYNRETSALELLRDTINDFNAFSRYTLYNPYTQHSVIDQTTQPRHLDYEFYLVSPQIGPEPIANRYNDTIRRAHVLDNYFAYDDGGAERGYLLMLGDQAAVRFDLQVPDVLSAVDLYFSPFRDNMQGSIIRVKGWGVGPDGKPDNNNLLFEKVVSINYQNLNNFTRVILDSPVPVSGSFFIGWRQTFGNKNVLGIDLNSNSSEFRYFGNFQNGNWLPDVVTTGSLMLRPVMGQNVVAAPDQLAANALQVYPNPSNGVFSVSGDYDAVDVFDSNGRQITLKQSAKGTIDLSGLPSGLYLMRAWQGNQFSTHKLMLSGQ